MNNFQWIWLGLSFSVVGLVSTVLFINILATENIGKLLLSIAVVCLTIAFIYDEWHELGEEANASE